MLELNSHRMRKQIVMSQYFCMLHIISIIFHSLNSRVIFRNPKSICKINFNSTDIVSLRKPTSKQSHNSFIKLALSLSIILLFRRGA